MIREEVKILKFMSEMTQRIDATEFARKLDLTPSELMQHMQLLAKEGLLRKSGGGFGITDRGRLALKAETPVDSNKRFHFYLELDRPTGDAAGSIKEFHDIAQKVNAGSLEFHLCRGDFENWFSDVVGDPEFSAELAILKKRNLMNEDLRTTIAQAIENRYSV